MKDYACYLTKSLACKAIQKGFPIERKFEPQNPINEFIRVIGHFNLPTAEQVCGWLREENNILITIGQKLNGDYPYYGYAYDMKYPEYAKTNNGYEYKEVLMDIIDKALDYLEYPEKLNIYKHTK